MTVMPAPRADTSVRPRVMHSTPQESISDFERFVATALMGGPDVVKAYHPGVFSSFVIVVKESINYARTHIAQGAGMCTSFIDAMADYLAGYTRTTATDVRASLDSYYHAHPGELEDMLTH